MGSGVAAGVFAGAGLLFLHGHAAALSHGLAHRGLPFVVVSAAGGVTSLGLLYHRHFLVARLAAAAAVTAVLWGWAAAQYPHLISPGITITHGAATHSVLQATIISLGVGAVVLVPSLTLLYILFQRHTPTE
jgi:cytochrome d ubiquinol oxidase subunit II